MEEKIFEELLYEEEMKSKQEIENPNVSNYKNNNIKL